MLIRYLHPLYEEDDGAKPQGGQAKPSDVLEQYGRDALRLAEKLADVQSDNYRLREERRNLKKDLDEARSKIPAEGSTFLTPEDAELLAEYRSFGTPDAIKKTLDDAGISTAELSRLRRAEQLRTVAEAAGYKASVLATLAGDLHFDVRPVKDGKPVVVVVKDGQETALEDYAKEAWEDFLPALRVAPPPVPYDINAGARTNGGEAPMITDEQRRAAAARYRATF